MEGRLRDLPPSGHRVVTGAAVCACTVSPLGHRRTPMVPLPLGGSALSDVDTSVGSTKRSCGGPTAPTPRHRPAAGDRLSLEAGTTLHGSTAVASPGPSSAAVLASPPISLTPATMLTWATCPGRACPGPARALDARATRRRG